MNLVEKIVMYTPPSKYTLEPFGRRAIVTLDDGRFRQYVQVAESGSEYAEWIDLGEFSLVVNQDAMEDVNLFNTMLEVYKKNKKANIKDEVI